MQGGREKGWGEKKMRVKKPQQELQIWCSGSVRRDCAGWVAARAASGRAYLQLCRAGRACLRLAGAGELN